MSDKKTLAIVYNKLWHYRRETFEELNRQYDLTIYYLEGRPYPDTSIKTVCLKKFGIGRVIIIRKLFISLLVKFDVVILYPDIGWLNTSLLLLFKRIFNLGKVIIWTPGVSASYSKRFDDITFWDPIRYFLYQGSDAIILYSEYAYNKLISSGFSENKLYVANNTVFTTPNKFNNNRDSILFIGTIYKAKGLDIFIDVYSRALKKRVNLPKVLIVGDGPELPHLRKTVEKRKISNQIRFFGRINNLKEKQRLFSQSLFCLGPDQAGLAVLESFGNGVPFVCTSNAYTGGERTNIKSGYNGLLISSIEDLYWVLLDWDNLNWHDMGLNAKNYYDRFASFSGNLKAIKNAIEST